MMDSITDQLKNLIIILADSQYDPKRLVYYTGPKFGHTWIHFIQVFQFSIFKTWHKWERVCVDFSGVLIFHVFYEI